MDQTTAELKFREALFQKYSQCEKHLLPRSIYNQTITDLKLAIDPQTKKSRHQYYLLSKYELLQCGDVEKLIKKRQSPEERPLYFTTIEDTFHIINNAHITTGHGGRDRMVKHLKDKYANITKDSVDLFKSYCLVCQEKRKRPKTQGVVVKPILSSEFNSRAQVDLIDMQSLPKGQFRWIMVYQCHLTKFVILRPLTSKRATEVAFQLLDIFLLFGAPAILQSDNGSEFTAQVITELKSLWPQLVMVHGKPRHPQSQGSVERANSDIKDILVSWMRDNNTNDWTIGLKFTQQQKNCSHHSGINQTPYKALFGENPKVGLTSSSLPAEILERLQSEDDLLALCHQPQLPTPLLQSTATSTNILPATTTDGLQSTATTTDGLQSTITNTLPAITTDGIQSTTTNNLPATTASTLSTSTTSTLSATTTDILRPTTTDTLSATTTSTLPATTTDILQPTTTDTLPATTTSTLPATTTNILQPTTTNTLPATTTDILQPTTTDTLPATTTSTLPATTTNILQPTTTNTLPATTTSTLPATTTDILQTTTTNILPATTTSTLPATTTSTLPATTTSTLPATTTSTLPATTTSTLQATTTSTLPATTADILQTTTTNTLPATTTSTLPATTTDILQTTTTNILPATTTSTLLATITSILPATTTDSLQSTNNNTLPATTTDEPSSILDQRRQQIVEQRKRARISQLTQAERMVKRSRVELKSAEIGDNVAIPIPMVDRGRGDPRNILGVILDRDELNMYTIAVKSGIISSKYSRNQFDLCPQKLLTDCDVNTECKVTLRQAVKATTLGGQGYFRCDCGHGKKQCQTNRCKCFKAGKMCNSRCHNSLTCKNK